MQEYLNNIRVVDNIVKQTEDLISSFYGDQETAYIFTADHGMSQIGNHGDGRKSPPPPPTHHQLSLLGQTRTTHARRLLPGAKASAAHCPTAHRRRTTNILSSGVFRACTDGMWSRRM